MLDERSKAKCFWVESIKQTSKSYPALSGGVDVDVVVIGAGITGLSVAEKLIEEGKTVAIVEALKVGRQSTGHSTAKVTSQHSLLYHKLAKSFGEGNAGIYAAANQWAVEEIFALVKRYSIDCDFERKDAYVYAESDKALQQIKEEVDAASRLGLPASFIHDLSLPFPVKGAIKYSGQAQFNPCKYTDGLAQALHEAGCRIFENTRVSDIDYGEPCRIKTDKGILSGRDVVMATHLPIGQTGLFYARAFPHAQPVIAARINTDSAPEGMYINADSPTHSFRTAMGDDAQLYLVATGKRYKPGYPDEEEGAFNDLRNFIENNFPIPEIDFFWMNEDYDSMDDAPFIGRASGHDHLYVATGFGAWGITNGMVAGRVIADLIMGRENNWAGFFDPARVKPISGGKKFITENLHVSKHLVGGYLETLFKSAEDVSPGEGKIIHKDGQYLALYKDENNQIFCNSAMCPHMGCLVGWNRSEGTWDCPCHGSRFMHDGTLIHGPATENLKPKDFDDTRGEG